MYKQPRFPTHKSARWHPEALNWTDKRRSWHRSQGLWKSANAFNRALALCVKAAWNWATKRSLSVTFGHLNLVEVVKKVNAGVLSQKKRLLLQRYLTFWAVDGSSGIRTQQKQLELFFILLHALWFTLFQFSKGKKKTCWPRGNTFGEALRDFLY